MTSALSRLHEFGQSPWLDFIRRSFLAEGKLAALVAEDGVAGVTSNPAIFEKAMGTGDDYDAEFRVLAEQGLDAGAIYETMARADIRSAAAVLRPVYDATGHQDGFVSLEVSPYLARDTAGTIAEARRLWEAVDCPNLMVKVPGTEQGTPAIRQLIEDGININVTLLFSQTAYQAVAEAYLAGLEARVAQGLAVADIACVASFFVSRIDAVMDKKIGALGDNAPLPKGRIAIANAKLAYRWYQATIASPRWQALAAHGAQKQRLLWASTGTKDPAYRDVVYVEELIGADTVNTLPPATMDAFRDHGTPRASITEGVDQAERDLAWAEELGLDLEGVTAKLVEDGVKQFADAFDQLLGAVATKRAALLADRMCSLKIQMPAQRAALETALETWRVGGKVRRLWARDASLWTGTGADQWLDWLDAVPAGQAMLATLEAFAEKSRGYERVLLLGMGGSSLGPEVLARVYGHRHGFPRLDVLDSTDPQQVAEFVGRAPLPRTCVLVASKSGSTLEPNILKAYVFEQMKRAVADPGAHFVAITDPGSRMQATAEADRFGDIFAGNPRIGGRFSVLSPFGLVPAASLGVDLRAFLGGAAHMVASCSAAAPPAANPGVQLGLALAVAARAGHDKVTLIASPGLASVGLWLEQLIAESTGKRGQALIPVEGETLRPPEAYGADRVFAYLRLNDASDAAQDRAVAALEQAGHPVIRLALNDKAELPQQFFLWEFAVAVACAELGINAFDQPDVEASKLRTRELTDAFNATGKLPAETPFARFGGIALFAAPDHAAVLKGGDLEAVLRAHFGQVRAGDYVALLAYLDQNPTHVAALQALRDLVGAKTRAACVAEFGPRFLHSTGQAYKGGPNTGVFLQITGNDVADLAVPGERFTFGIVKAAQAQGDFDVLCERGRRALRVHLDDVPAGLATLQIALEAALG